MSAAENAWQQRGACNGAATATDSTAPAVPSATPLGAPCPTCGGIGVVPGRDDEQTCHTCEGACFVEFVCPGERTCRVCPEHQYSEPQDQR